MGGGHMFYGDADQETREIEATTHQGLQDGGLLLMIVCLGNTHSVTITMVSFNR